MLPPIFLDLAIILITAGVITIIFKWLKQPLVLGYILAGFFIGPYFPWFPIVNDEANIRVWSDIGIVFLMFAMGLEFSVKKLKKVGASGVVTALTELAVMFPVGSLVGKALGFGQMDCIFLGCMLSVTSTAIITKSFDDLKLKHQKFTNTVTAALVADDLVGMLLLVVLTTFGVSKSFDGAQLAFSIGKMAFFLVVCFVFGIYLVPTFLRWMRRYMTEETLCIVAVGLCLAMVVLASYAGLSTALGAFMMGTILAETIEADVIHRVIAPIKNLFGAVFFVSVGMLVDPAVLVNYIVPILVISLTIIVVKSSAATLGVLLSGKPLKTAIQAGSCFGQISEISYIIAGVGLSYGIINKDLYPIIVTVSIITTFVTPYMIKGAVPFHDKIAPRLPKRVVAIINRYSSSAKSADHEASMRKFVKKQLTSVLLYGAVLVALSLLSFSLLKPFLNSTAASLKVPELWSNLLGAVATLVVMAPFLWALAVKGAGKRRIKQILATYRQSQAVVVPLLLLRYVAAVSFVGFVLARYVNLAIGFVLVLALIVVVLVLFTNRSNEFYDHIESHFISNFNQRQAQHSFQMPQDLEDDFLMERVYLSEYSPYAGQTLMASNLRHDYGINVVSIERRGQVIDLPGKDELLLPCDRLTLIGHEEQISKVREALSVEPDMLIHDHSDNEMSVYCYVVDATSPLLGLDLRQAGHVHTHRAMVIAMHRGGAYMLNPPATTVFEEGDTVWFVSPEKEEAIKGSSINSTFNSKTI